MILGKDTQSAGVLADGALPPEPRLGGCAEPGGDQQRAELIAVQPGGVGLVVQAGSAHVRGRGVVEKLFLDGVLAEPGDGAQPARDGSPGPAFGFQVAGKALDVSAAHLEKAQATLMALPADSALFRTVRHWAMRGSQISQLWVGSVGLLVNSGGMALVAGTLAA